MTVLGVIDGWIATEGGASTAPTMFWKSGRCSEPTTPSHEVPEGPDRTQTPWRTETQNGGWRDYTIAQLRFCT